MGQLGRILLSGSSGSQDEQSAAPEGSGSYGELMDEIDQLIESNQTSTTGRTGSRAEFPPAAFAAACRSIHALRSGCGWGYVARDRSGARSGREEPWPRS